MHDALHLRSDVPLLGVCSVLVKNRAIESRLTLDGDYGEEQITLDAPEGFVKGSTKKPVRDDRQK